MLKKENYFDDNNRIKSFASILSAIYKQKNKTRFDVNKSALVVLDMQTYFTDRASHAYVPASEYIINKINSLVSLFESNNRPIILTKHTNDNINAKMMGKWWKHLIKVDNSLSQINEKIKTDTGIILNKTQYDAFFNTGLDEFLKTRNIEQILVTGVMTHLCCETTIRSAFVRGYEVFFPIDTTATYNLEFHKSSFINLSHGFCTPFLVDEIIGSNNLS